MTVSNISSKATGSNVTKFLVECPWAEGMKICTNRQGHMTNMATMPIYGKNLSKNLLPQNQLSNGLETCMYHWVLEYYHNCINADLGLILTYFTTESTM